MNEATEIAWLAGILEGEGSFGYHLSGHGNSGRISIQIGMTDRDIIERVAVLFGGRRVYVHKRRENRKQAYSAILTGHAAAELMGALRPLMGERRQKQIEAALSSWTNRPVKLRPRGQPAECHPERPHKGRGLCGPCFRAERYRTSELPSRRSAALGIDPRFYASAGSLAAC